MKIVFFSAKPYDERFFEGANREIKHELFFLKPQLEQHTAQLAAGYDAVCAFVNDTLDRETIEILADGGVKSIALRCAGFNNVDLAAAQEHGIRVVRVPAYSPYAVAEHTLAIILALNRNVHRAYNRVREGNFALDGLLGFDINGLTAGVVGTGRIGIVVSKILTGFGCRVLAFDPYPNDECTGMGVQYVSERELFERSDIITLHCPLTPESDHLINDEAIELMKTGVMLVNTSRGRLIDTQAVLRGLKSGKIGHLGLDVYEEEGDLFFEDLSSKVIQDDVFARLTTFPNVVITGHQAFFTRDAMENIAMTTLSNLTELESTGKCQNEVTVD